MVVTNGPNVYQGMFSNITTPSSHDRSWTLPEAVFQS